MKEMIDFFTRQGFKIFPCNLNVYRYSANVDITPKGKNNSVYFDEFNLNECLREIICIIHRDNYIMPG